MEEEIRRNQEPEKKRRHCVSCRMNEDELHELDQRRGKYTRGEYLRLALFSSLPPAAPPSLNREAWLALSKVAGNLATIATAMRGGEYMPLDEIRAEVEEFRHKLIGVNL